MIPKRFATNQTTAATNSQVTSFDASDSFFFGPAPATL